ncbi:S8 family serine peptidase [Microbulbifer pacificus]|uniref:S8 family serine peptidase n=1 Tax=Microbulbifer pacificus TaxID=407164 RepID=UPI001319EF7C|nr:S8 family serine peptidase [Microbulbifer pacificus]
MNKNIRLSKNSLKYRIQTLAATVALSSICASATWATPSINVSGLLDDARYDRFIVKYRSNKTATNKQAAIAKAAKKGVGGKAVALQALRQTATGDDVIVSSQKLDRSESQALMQQLAADPDVEYVEVDALLQAGLIPDDPQYPYLWGLHEEVSGINAHHAWDRGNGKSAIVAVLDTGITEHSDLVGNLLPGYDFIAEPNNANDGDGRDSDPSDPGDYRIAGECSNRSAGSSTWHGTHVAGTIAAVANNEAGIVGVAPGAGIVPVRVLGKCGGYISDISDAIIWASGGAVPGIPVNEFPADVINMSLGGLGSCGTTYQNAIDTAVQNGTAIVVSAGNDDTDASEKRPANCNNVIAVAATTNIGARAYFSNYGTAVDIAALGEYVLSTHNTGTNGPSAETYSYMSGTSMAAPHVSGALALLTEHYPTSAPEQKENLLKSTARAIPVTPMQPMGTGIVDAHALTTRLPQQELLNGVLRRYNKPTTDYESYWIEVPAGASTLTFVNNPFGTHYVQYASPPTDTDYDCKWGPGTIGGIPSLKETCTLDNPQPGIYYVDTKYLTSQGMNANNWIIGSYSMPNGGGTQIYQDFDVKPFPASGILERSLAVFGRNGNAPVNASIHYQVFQDYTNSSKSLIVDLIAPDGSVYNLKDQTAGFYSWNAGNEVKTLDLSGELLNGIWTIRVTDTAVTEGRVEDSNNSFAGWLLVL